MSQGADAGSPLFSQKTACLLHAALDRRIRNEAFAGKAQRTRIRLGFSSLARYLKQDCHWTNTDYANIVIAFRVAYSIGQILCGRLLDPHRHKARVDSFRAVVLPGVDSCSESVASVSGMSGTGAGIGTIVAFKLIGYFSNQTAGAHSLDPIVIVAGMIPFSR